MIGLALKDFIVMRKTIKTYGVVLLMYLIMSAIGIFPIFYMSCMVVMIIMMLPIAAFSYDEQAHWAAYSLTFPLGRPAIVKGRYLFTIFLLVCAILYGLLSSTLLSITGDHSTLTENLITVLVSMELGLLYCDILLPLCYKLGHERARPYLYVIIFLPIILFFGAAQLGFLDSLDLSFLSSFSAWGIVGIFTVIFALPVAGLWLSYRISCGIVAKQEY